MKLGYMGGLRGTFLFFLSSRPHQGSENEEFSDLVIVKAWTVARCFIELLPPTSQKPLWYGFPLLTTGGFDYRLELALRALHHQASNPPTN